jgi:hypothetical protein
VRLLLAQLLVPSAPWSVVQPSDTRLRFGLVVVSLLRRSSERVLANTLPEPLELLWIIEDVIVLWSHFNRMFSVSRNIDPSLSSSLSTPRNHGRVILL